MKIKLLILSGLLLLNVSCKDYLDLKPYGKVIPKTAEEYSAMIHKILNDIEGSSSDPYVIKNSSKLASEETMSDNLDANIFLVQDLFPSSLSNRIPNASSEYSGYYAQIRNCNIVLDGLAKDNSQLAKDVMGTAQAIRGVCYYQLLRDFCEPVVAGVYPKQGLPLVETFDMEYRPIRSSYKETVDFVVKDFKASIAKSVSDKKYLFTTDVVKGYLARLYFWVGDWDNAKTIAQELLKKYPLISGDAYLDMLKSNSLRGNALIKSGTNDAEGSESVTQGQLKRRPINKNYIDIFDYQDKDIRYKNFFTKKRELSKKLFSGMRSAEWALIVAECNYHQGDNQAALDVINDLRRHRITDYTDLTLGTLTKRPVALITKDAMDKDLTPVISLILNERRAEMMAEGDRIYELKRNGTPEFWISRNGMAYVTQKYMYTLPLPINDIDLIKGLVQNPGYTEFEN